MLATITRAIQALAGKATTAQVMQASMSRADLAGGRYRSNQDASLLNRYVGYTAIACNVNAVPLSTLTLRLYRKRQPLTLGMGDGPRSGGMTVGTTDTPKLSPQRRLDLKRFARATGRKTIIDAVEADDVEEVAEHPILDLLYRPNSEMSQSEFLFIIHRYINLPGMAPVHAEPGTNGPANLWPMLPQYTRVEADKTGERLVAGYWYGQPGSEVWIPAEEVLPFRYAMSPFDPLRPWCPLHAIMDEHDIYQAAGQLKLQLWDNGLMPSWMISPKGDNMTLTPENRKQIERSLFENHRGISKALGAIISTLPIELTKLSWSPSEVNDTESREAAIDAIAMAYGIPAPLLRMNDSILANAGSATRFHQEKTLLPQAARCAEVLTEYLVPMYGLDPNEYWIAFDSPVEADEQLASTNASTLYTGGIATLNEARRMVNLDPRDDGDELKAPDPQPSPFGGFGLGLGGSHPGSDPPSMGLGLGTDNGGEQPSLTMRKIDDDERGTVGGLAGKSDPSGGEHQHGGGQRGAGAEPIASESGEGQCADGTCGCAGKGVRVLQSEYIRQDAAKWLAEVSGKQIDLEGSIEYALFAGILAVFDEQKLAFVTAMQNAPQGLQFGRVATKDDRGDQVERIMQRWGMLDYEAWARRFNGQTVGVIQEAIRQATLLGIEKMERAGIEVPQALDGFYLRTERGLAFLREYTEAYEERFVDVSRTTAEAIRAELTNGLQEGESLSKLTARVRSVFDGESSIGDPVSRVRAAMIARTETAESQMHGQYRAFDEAGVKELEWLLAPNACEFCRAVAQRYKRQKLGVPFFMKGEVLQGLDGGQMTLDFKDVYGPPLHPNDRCDIVPVVGG